MIIKFGFFLFLDEEFRLLQQNFMEKHYLEFEDSEENKLSYTTIFNDYVSPGVWASNSWFLHRTSSQSDVWPSWDLENAVLLKCCYCACFGLCRSACWRNTWSSSSLWGSLASIWTASQSCWCKTREYCCLLSEASGLVFDAPAVLPPAMITIGH